MVGPIVSQTLSDVFCDNEYGPNFLFRNNGNGTFTDVAQQAGERNSLTDHSLGDQLTYQGAETIHKALPYTCRCGGPHAAWQRRCSGRLQP